VPIAPTTILHVEWQELHNAPRRLSAAMPLHYDGDRTVLNRM
jgi:hypothetical protein